MSGGMLPSQLDRLDQCAAQLIADTARLHAWGPMSTGEKLYVALAANREDLLQRMGYTIAQAVARVGEDDMRELVRRWQYR